MPNFSPSDITAIELIARSLKEIAISTQRIKMAQEQRKKIQAEAAAIEFFLPRKLSSWVWRMAPSFGG